ncbi:MAG: hypothetical protein GX094_04860 [Clostridiales bacterium]|nr:hypothetical protein [Clostridiales bacterium]
MEKKRIKYAVFLIAVFLTIVFIPNTDPAKALEQKGQIDIVYFYDNPCAACDEEGKFIELFNSIVGEYKKGVEIHLSMHNVFHESGWNLLQQYYEEFGVPEDRQTVPILFINNEYLSGSTAIQEELKDVFLREKGKIAIDEVDSGDDIQTTIVYFYVTACKECEEVAKILDTLEERYPLEFDDEGNYTYVEVKKFNIGEAENLQLVRKYFEVFDVPEKEQSVPIIFVGDIYLSGLEAIRQELVQRIKAGEGIRTPVLSTEESADPRSSVSLEGYNVVGVLLTGLVNGLNPCSLSMLLFFLSLLLAKGTNILKMGFAFCFGKFLAYLLLGSLLFNVFLKLQVSWVSAIVKGIILIIAFIIIVMNLRDYFAAKKEKYDKIRMQLPTVLRKYNHKWIKKFTSTENARMLLIGSFSLGMIISAGEFLCTGQIYLATIVYVLRSSPAFNLQAFAYFILYTLAFIIPLLVITIIIYKGKEVFDVSELIRERMPIIKLINAALFFIFGLAVLIWF